MIPDPHPPAPTRPLGRPVAGLFVEPQTPAPPRTLQTGVPLVLGYAGVGPVAKTSTPAAPGARGWREVAMLLTAPADATRVYGAPGPGGHLADAVQGFFANGGTHCYGMRLDDQVSAPEAVRQALELAEDMTSIDLVLVPDAWRDPGSATAVQQCVLADCTKRGDRFAILDAGPDAALPDAVRQWQQLIGTAGAVYFPWVGVAAPGGIAAAPPSGHVAGVYARSDRSGGVVKAPANEPLDAVLDLMRHTSLEAQAAADPAGVVNCLRPTVGRGIRIWGARTTSRHADWQHVGVRRLFSTTIRWLARELEDMEFEPNDTRLWARIRRQVNDYLFKLFTAGALRGATPQDAYFVHCDGTTTSLADREAGRVIVDIGLAPVRPARFIVVRVVHDAGGLRPVAPDAA